MSDRKKAAAARRDARHAKVADTAPSTGKKKNTRRWCRGKVGVEHQAEWRDYRTAKGMAAAYSERMWRGWRVRICTVCGKELETDTGPRVPWTVRHKDGTETKP